MDEDRATTPTATSTGARPPGGIKLRPADHEALARAAFLYGIRPSTMARLLVNRGVRAVLESHDGPARS